MEVTKQASGILSYDYRSTRTVEATDPDDPVVEVENVRMETPTNRVPARLGISFGVVYYLDHWQMKMEVPLRCCIYHPPLFPPNGKGKRTHVAFEFTGDTDDENFSFFTFDHPWEIASGRWVFRVFYQNIKLVDQAFDVYPYLP